MAGEKRDMTLILPDDVLASIFSLLHPTDLISCVPLVCKRWCQLSKDPDAWRYADLIVVPKTLMERAAMMEAHGRSSWKLSNHLVRMAKLAPYLRTVDLHMVDTLFPCAESVVKLLIENNTIVKNLHTFPKCTKKMQTLTKKLLKMLSPSLRSIKFSCSDGDTKKAATFFVGANELLQIISKAPKLNHLAFDFHNLKSSKGYSGQLGKGCAVLKKFEVMNHQACHDNVILDVLRNKKDQLVQVGFNSDLSKDIANALNECQGLSKCRLLIKHIHLVESMSQLDALEIGLIKVSAPHDIPVESIKSSNVLPNISKLTLWGRADNSFNPASSLEISAKTVEILAQKCKNVKVFKMVDINLPDHLLNLLMTNFQNLQEISVETCGGITGHHINMLSEVPTLRAVSMCDIIVKSKEDVTDLKTAFDQLSLLKPNAVLSLNCEMSPFVELEDDDSDDSDDDDDLEYDEYGDPVLTYYDYLRNKYGDEISDMDLWALASASSDED